MRLRGLYFAAILVPAILAGCELYDPMGPTAEEVLAIEPCFNPADTSSTTPCNLPADGQSQVLIRVRLKPMAAFPSDDGEITVRTTAGVLAAGTGQGDAVTLKTAGGAATVGLTSSRNPGPVALTANARGLSVKSPVEFDPALPSTMVLRTEGGSSATADGNAAIQLVVELSRPPQSGRPSIGLRVEFVPFVVDSSGVATEVQNLKTIAVADSASQARATLRSLQPYDVLRVYARTLDTAGEARVFSDAVTVRFKTP